jgi:hypothetical protein
MTPQETTRWVVYVPQGAKRNLEIAISKCVWGFSETSRRHATFQNIKRGDILILASAYEASTPDSQGLGGRRKLDDFLGAFDKVVGFNVHKGYYFSKEPIWLDQIYPYRVNLGTILFSKTHLVVDYLGHDLRACLHRAMYQSPVEINEGIFIELRMCL